MRNWKLIYMCEQYNRICKLYSQIGEESIYGKLIEHLVYAYIRIYMVVCARRNNDSVNHGEDRKSGGA